VNASIFLKLFPIKCSYTGSDYVDQLMLVTITPIVLTILWWILYKMCKYTIELFGTRTRALSHSLKVNFIFVFLMFTYLILPGVSTLIAGAIPCTNVDPDRTTKTPELYLR